MKWVSVGAKLWRAAVVGVRVVSAALLLLVLMLWFWSYHQGGCFRLNISRLTRERPDAVWLTLDSRGGGLKIRFDRMGVRRELDPVLDSYFYVEWAGRNLMREGWQETTNTYPEELGLSTRFGFGTFAFSSATSPNYHRTSGAVVPYCGLALLFSVPLALWLWERRRRRELERLRKENEGACPCATCGYDLRASTERCPGCGSPIAEANVRHS